MEVDLNFVQWNTNIFSCEASSTYCNLNHSLSNRPLASSGILGILGHAETYRDLQGHSGECRGLQGMQEVRQNTGKYRGIQDNKGK